MIFSKSPRNTLQDFNRKDVHTTPEGKAAYNCRIRCFLIYLYEQGLICNPYLYKALPTMSAPRTVIVQTLSSEDMAYICLSILIRFHLWNCGYYAIVCVGLTMGSEALTSVLSSFEISTGRRRSICLTQEKTGKNIALPMPVKPVTFCSDISVMADQKVPMYMYLSSTKHLSKGFIAAYVQKP